MSDTTKSSKLATAKKVITLDIGDEFKNSPENILGLSERKQRWSAIAEMLKGVLKRSDRRETFEEAEERLELTDAHLARRRYELSIESRIWYGVGMGSLMIATFWATGIFAVLVCLGFGVSAFMQGAIRAIWVRQIDIKKLEGIGPWLRDSQYWFV